MYRLRHPELVRGHLAGNIGGSRARRPPRVGRHRQGDAGRQKRAHPDSLANVELLSARHLRAGVTPRRGKRSATPKGQTQPGLTSSVISIEHCHHRSLEQR